VHDSYAALAADPDIDLVYVATPPAFHREQALLAIAAGKPVLVEKPFTRDAGEAEALLAAGRAAGVPVLEAMHSRLHALWPLVARLLPQIGAIRHVDAVFDVTVSTADSEFRWDAALGGGALMDLGIYPLAWARAVAGEPLAVTMAGMRRLRNADAAVSATLAMPGGVTASIAADMTAPRRASLTVTGSAGTLHVDNPLAPQLGHRVIVTTAAGTTEHVADGPGTYDAQLAAAIAHVRDGASWPLAADDPLASMRAIAMVRAAAMEP
jgi:predicted dehydrogenase